MDLDYRISGWKTTSQSPVYHKGINPKEGLEEGAEQLLLNQLVEAANFARESEPVLTRKGTIMYRKYRKERTTFPSLNTGGSASTRWHNKG